MEYRWFTFCTRYIQPLGGSRYSVQSLSVYAPGPEQALRVAVRRGPRAQIWTWFEGLPDDPDVSCGLCGGPWHQASGHVNLQKGQVWCGACTKDTIVFLRTMLPRRWGGARFYDHAGPLPERPPPGWEP